MLATDTDQPDPSQGPVSLRDSSISCINSAYSEEKQMVQPHQALASGLRFALPETFGLTPWRAQASA